jgi:hypothetical protein
LIFAWFFDQICATPGTKLVIFGIPNFTGWAGFHDGQIFMGLEFYSRDVSTYFTNGA